MKYYDPIPFLTLEFYKSVIFYMFWNKQYATITMYDFIWTVIGNKFSF